MEELGDGHRYGFNGKEQDNDIDGTGVDYEYGFRIYDARIGRFFSVDPFADKFPAEAPYIFAGNNPSNMTDYNGCFKVSPWFAKRYPSLAKFLQYAVPSLINDHKTRDRWIQYMDITTKDNNIDYEKGTKIWNELLTFGSGPYIDPMRPDKEFNSRNTDLNNFAFGQPTGGIFGSSYGYPNNVSVGYSYFDDVEAALDNGNNEEAGYKMFLMFIMIMHEGGHWARYTAGLPPRSGNGARTTDYEDGAMSEEGIFGERFNYRSGFEPDYGGESKDALDTKEATTFYNNYLVSIGDIGKTAIVIPKIRACLSLPMFKSLPTPKGQKGDKTITDNNTNEDGTPPKRQKQKNHRGEGG